MKNNELLRLGKVAEEALKANDTTKLIEAANSILRVNRSAGLAYLGVASLRKDEYESAEKYLLESFQINEKQHLALANLIPTYIKLRDFKKAVAFGEQAYSLLSNNQSVAINFAAALLQEQNFSKAVDVLLPHLDEAAPISAVISGLISAYRSMFNREEAERLLGIAEKHFGDKHEIIRIKADTLAEREPALAINYFKAALEKEPNNVATRWNMSLVQLRLGEFKEGWVNYDCGLLPEVGKIGRPLPKLFEGARRVLDVDQLDPDKWTFAVCEQGIGDQVMFLGVMPEFLKDYPKTILIAEKRFKPILMRSFPDMPVYPYGAGPLLSSNDLLVNGYVPIGSLQKKYRSSKESCLAIRQTYLKPDEGRVNKFRQTLLQKTGAKKIVGFSWKGGFWERAQKTKTMEIELWDPIFEDQETIFVSLQYGEISKEKAHLATKFKNIRWIDGLDFKKDLDSWFALMCACDEIISVSTALVHFAGAAGKRVNLLLSDRGAPFIWGLQDEHSIAYPDIRIHRKNVDQTNKEFFELVASKALSQSTGVMI